jgi:hypothetical protein
LPLGDRGLLGDRELRDPGCHIRKTCALIGQSPVRSVLIEQGSMRKAVIE